MMTGCMQKTGMRWLLAPFVVLLLLTASEFAGAVNPEDLLPVEQAYRLQTPQADPDMLRLTWEIADGYYLYRDKFHFESSTDGIELGTPVFPAGKTRVDEFFGEMEIYRDRVTVDIPVVVHDSSVSTVTVNAVSQGCADVGVCYAPQKQQVSFSLPPPAASTTGDNTGGFLGSLKKLGSRLGLVEQPQTYLHPDKAFVMTVNARDANHLVAHWDIADNYYLYREHFHIKVTNPSDTRVTEIESPQGRIREDEYFGRKQVYYNGVDLLVNLQRQSQGAQPVTLEMQYQGCADGGFCYPPITKNIEVMLPAVTAGGGDSGIVSTTNVVNNLPEQDRIARLLAGDKAWLTALGMFGVGILLAFTPCVFPMVPILSSIIVGQGGQVTTRRAFSLSLVYVLAMAVMYTIAGVIAGLFGENLQILFQNTWIIIGFSLVFVLLALSMFGLYELQLPSSWQSRLNQLGNRQQSGTWIGVAVMGVLSALIVGPCVAAPLAGVLIYIGMSGDAMLGGFSLLMMSLGMGLPLLIIGTSAGKLLPRAGAWMTTVKDIFGVLLLALAIWMLDRIVPPQATLFLSAALLIGTAVYMGAFSRLEPEATGWQKLWKGTGLLMSVYGVLLVIGAASGSNDILQPLKGLEQDSAAQTQLQFKRIKGTDGLQRELQAAAAQGRPVMLDFYADWCVDCKKLEKATFASAGVQRALGRTYLLQTDVTLNDDADQALLKRFGLFGPPAILFFDSHGRELSQYRLIGFLDAGDFQDHVSRALDGQL